MKIKVVRYQSHIMYKGPLSQTLRYTDMDRHTDVRSGADACLFIIHPPHTHAPEGLVREIEIC